MTCPACNRELASLTHSGITVDACAGGCGGLWFDAHELQKVDETHEDGEALLDVPRDAAWKSPEDARARTCPKCRDVTMLQHFSSVKRGIEVDECGNCGGFFFDGGELGKLRTEFPTQVARDEEAQKEFDASIDGLLGTMKASNDAERAKVARVARAFRFICPSYYLSGKQAWGAY